jgi:hypothetical protein
MPKRLQRKQRLLKLRRLSWLKTRLRNLTTRPRNQATRLRNLKSSLKRRMMLPRRWIASLKK